MSYLPPANPYAPQPPAFPPQAGLGGQPGAFPGANPYAAAQPMDPMAALQGLQGGGYPGAQADPMAALQGMGADSFGPAQNAGMQQPGVPAGAPAQGQQPAGVFQHQSGGFADKNTTLSSGGSFWTSGKGIATIIAGTAALIYGGVAMAKGRLNIFASKEETKIALNAATGELKDKLKAFTGDIEGFRTKTLLKDLKKENADTNHEAFKKQVDDYFTADELKTFDNTEPLDNLKKAYMDQADAIKKAASEGKAIPEDLSTLDKDLAAKITKAEDEYKEAIRKPETKESTGDTKPTDTKEPTGDTKPTDAKEPTGDTKPTDGKKSSFINRNGSYNPLKWSWGRSA